MMPYNFEANSPARRTATLILSAILLFTCQATAADGDRFGRTYYIDGAGNWGYGVAEITEGLHAVGYKGAVINFTWSPTLNPALDQTVGRPIARLKGMDLAKEINRYLAKYPKNEVNIICLSAGTGVGIWACENLQSPAKVRNLVMLGASISSDYDARRALEHISGHIYVYHSHGDMVLQGPVRSLGTIDGKLGVDPAGVVGLRPRGLRTEKIVNIPWAPRYERYGWTGAHTDATSEPFVRAYLSKHVLPEPAPATPPTAATQPAAVQADKSVAPVSQ